MACGAEEQVAVRCTPASLEKHPAQQGSPCVTGKHRWVVRREHPARNAPLRHGRCMRAGPEETDAARCATACYESSLPTVYRT
jgi:hypothetical protein